MDSITKDPSTEDRYQVQNLEESAIVHTLVQSPVHIEQFKNILCRALEQSRNRLVYHLAATLYESFRLHHSGVAGIGEQTGAWIHIESLSQLRSVVGGRFQNLKQKWTDAGLPLREHRGDRKGNLELDSEGWLKLSLWIGEQGYEVRLPGDGDPWLFEVKKVS